MRPLEKGPIAMCWDFTIVQGPCLHDNVGGHGG